jgi:DedD protein
MGDSFRNIERIEETDEPRKVPWGVTTAFVVLGGACITFAVLALGGRTSAAPQKKSDPLGDLLAEQAHGASHAPASAPPATELSAKDVTFPRILSDGDHPAAALAAVPSMQFPPGPAASALLPSPVAEKPPPPTDRLSVVALPAQTVLEATPIVTRPRDALTRAASDAAKIDVPASTTGAAPAGHEGGYQLQVSSFPTQAEAQSFADQLRARGHKAYFVQANVPGRGTWYRVRIGPFSTQRSAADYRTDFEDREHVVPFIVTP